MKKLFKTLITVLMVILTVCSFPLAANAETLDVGIPVEEYPELFITGTLPTHGEGRVLVFLIQFPDMLNDDADATAEYFNELYFKPEPFSRKPLSTGEYSVSGFYEQESYGKLKLTGEVFGWYTAKHERAYYDGKKLELIEEAARYYMDKGEDLSGFDADNDGVIDALVFHFAGEASQNKDDPWYGGTNYGSDFTHSIADKKIGGYIQVHSEISKMSHSSDLRKTVCHELMHSLGLYDLYGDVWKTLDATDDLMNKNDADINPYYKMLLGWTKKITIVNSSINDIRLNEWLKTGEALLVTDSFNGIFDEFYMITYKEVKQSVSKDGTTSSENPNQIRIFRIDARLNEAKTEFLYDNYKYTPRDADPHGAKKISEYLFIEELSAVPAYDRVVNKSSVDLYFKEGSILGPNTIPNTDTHSGRYTGIRIDDFKRYGDHATMDITVEKQDTTAPRVSEGLSSIGFSGENKLRFDQNIYTSDNWAAIKVTDLSGNVLNAEIKKSRYPAHEIEVNITSDIPRDGFKILLPAGCVCDSSGNKNEAEEIVVVNSESAFVEAKEFIPWYYENKSRMWEGDPKCFKYGDESIIITSSGEGTMKEMTKFIEFIKTDAEGNITAHKFIINPVPDAVLINAIQTKDGGYLITGNGKQFILCIDKNGDLRWQKNTDHTLGTPVQIGDRVQFYYCRSASDKKIKIATVDPITGSITLTDLPSSFEVGNPCYNGKSVVSFSVKNNTNIIAVNEFDPATLQKARQPIELPIPEASKVTIMSTAYNGNGSYTVIMRIQEADTGLSKFMAISLDSNFKVMKTLFFKVLANTSNRAYTYPDDGFAIVTVTGEGEHGNDTFHVMRADKNLNLMWEADLETAHLGVFVTSGNQICAFGSDFVPKRYAYLFKLGSEDKFEVESHALSHREAVEATCNRVGETEHWICLDCKKTFSDAEGKNEIPSSSVYLPKTDHVIVPCDEIKPTCTENGYTGGTCCKHCKLIVSERTLLKATGHDPQPYEEVEATCESAGYTGGSFCRNCNAELEERTAISKKKHNYTTYDVEPTCTQTGMNGGLRCADCGYSLKAPNIVKAKGHSKVKNEDVPATCTTDGSSGGTYCSVCGEQLTPKTVIKARGHRAVKGEDVAATCTADGCIGAVSCKVCGDILEEKKVIKALGHTAVTDPAVEPTRKSEGLTEGSHCSVCGVTLVAQETVEALKPSVLTVALIIAVPCAAVAALAAVIIVKRKKR